MSSSKNDIEELKNDMLSIKRQFKNNNDEIKNIKNLTKEYNKKRIGTHECYATHMYLLGIYNDLFKQYQTAKKAIIKFQSRTKYPAYICGGCEKWIAKCSLCGKWSKYMFNNDDITLCDDEKCIKKSGYDDLDRGIWDKPCYAGGCDSLNC